MATDGLVSVVSASEVLPLSEDMFTLLLNWPKLTSVPITDSL